MLNCSLIGNDPVKTSLHRLVENDRVPGSLLFVGPEGVGKRHFAIEFAKTLLCGDRGCGTCRTCLRITLPDIPRAEKGEEYDRVFLTPHPDVGLVVPFKRNVRVGAIRELEREAFLMPYEGQKRIFIVEAAERMNDSAANALLKTLEEPPVTTHIILVTSRPDSLLPTIGSRCQTIRFAPVDTAKIADLVISTTEMENEDALLAARVCKGSVGRAVNFDPQWFRSVRSAMLGVVKAARVTGDFATLLEVGESMNDVKNKDRFDEALEILQSVIHDVLALRVGASAGSVLNNDVTSELVELSTIADTKTLSRWLVNIEDLFENLKVNANRKIAADALFVGMTA